MSDENSLKNDFKKTEVSPNTHGISGLHFGIWNDDIVTSNGEVSYLAKKAVETAQCYGTDLMVPLMIFMDRAQSSCYNTKHKYALNPEDLDKFLAYADSRGVNVTIIPHSWYDDATGTPDTWRGFVKPQDIRSWSHNYIDTIMPYLKVASNHGIGEFVILSEMNEVVSELHEEGLIQEFFCILEDKMDDACISADEAPDFSMQLHGGEDMGAIRDLSQIDMLKTLHINFYRPAPLVTREKIEQLNAHELCDVIYESFQMPIDSWTIMQQSGPVRACWKEMQNCMREMGHEGSFTLADYYRAMARLKPGTSPMLFEAGTSGDFMAPWKVTHELDQNGKEKLQFAYLSAIKKLVQTELSDTYSGYCVWNIGYNIDEHACLIQDAFHVSTDVLDKLTQPDQVMPTATNKSSYTLESPKR